MAPFPPKKSFGGPEPMPPKRSAPPAPPVAEPEPMPEETTKLIRPDAVGYRDASERCGACQHFSGPGQCAMGVDGPINEDDSCNLFEGGGMEAMGAEEVAPDMGGAPMPPTMKGRA
jgi:hypothetical protein